MAEILSPGVFIEEVPSAAVTVQPVSTSNMGILGATQRGPTDEATLVTSFEQYSRIFGDQIPESRLHLSMAAFYSNGGKRAFVVRVMPSDAVKASADVRSARYNHYLFKGDGSTVSHNQGSSGAVSLATFVAPGTVTMRYRDAGLVVSAQTLRNRTDTANVALVASRQRYEARVLPSALPDVDPSLPAIAPGGAVVLTYDPGTGDATIPLTAPSGHALVGTTTTVEGTVVVLDYVTGFLSVEFAGTEAVGGSPVGSLRLSYRQLSATRIVTDDGAGTLVGSTMDSSSIDYDTGDYVFKTLTDEVGNGCPVLANYQVQAWTLAPISVGTWSNNVKVSVVGNSDFYDAATSSYSRFNVNVSMLNSVTGSYDIKEVFEEITFSDEDSAQYFPAVVNDLSDLISVTATAVHAEAPAQLGAVGYTQTIAGGDQQSGNRQIQTTLVADSIAPRTVVISYADNSGNAKVVTDNGSGKLVGDVDVSGTNTINYATGEIDVTLSVSVNGGSLVQATFYAAAEETSHVEQFGDTTKNYTDSTPVEHYVAGANGTYNTTNWGRSQFTSYAVLASTYKGLYAFDRVDELMQVVLPDYPGDVTMTKDLLDYADLRSNSPAGGDRFIILTVPQGSSAQDAVNYIRYDLNQFCKFAALYWPWVKVADPLKNNRSVAFPPLGHLAGIYARTDSTRNVGKAPGGTIDGALKYLTGLEMDPTLGERDYVYPNRVNPLISSAQTGLAVWGVRTMAQESEWRYINARRLFMFVERSVFNSTHWIVFENNGAALWTRIKAQLQGFLLGLFNDGLFAGATPAQAFYVICDESNNLPETIAAGQVIIDVGIAPNKPAEFVRFRFTQKTTES